MYSFPPQHCDSQKVGVGCLCYQQGTVKELLLCFHIQIGSLYRFYITNPAKIFKKINKFLKKEENKKEQEINNLVSRVSSESNHKRVG